MSPVAPPGASPDVFSLLVTLQFSDKESLEQFATAFVPMQKYVKDHEPSTLVYDLLQSDKDPLQVLVLEQYESKHAYLEIHKKSKEFLNFRPKLQQLQNNNKVQIQGGSYGMYPLES